MAWVDGGRIGEGEGEQWRAHIYTAKEKICGAPQFHGHGFMAEAAVSCRASY